MKGSDFIFDCVHLLYYKCRKINFKQGESDIDSADCIKNKKEAISLIKKKDNKSFQYAVAAALNHEYPQGKTKIEGINYPSEKELLLIIWMLEKKKYITQIVKKQVILLMIPNGEEWYYLAVKNYQHY